MLRRGFEIGMSIGNISTALLNGIHYIQKALMGGVNLIDLRGEVEYQLRLIDKYSPSHSKAYISYFQQTISLLINKETSINQTVKDISSFEEFSEALAFHHAMQSFWLGRYERCNFYADRVNAYTDIGKLKSLILQFYNGLSAFRLMRSKKKKPFEDITKNSIEAMRAARADSKWNYGNKLHLLEAERYSSTGMKEKAKVAYCAAIESSCASRFIHEQALACEFAALHFSRIGEKETAMSFLNQAKECYAKWGSQTKVDFVASEINTLKSKIQK